MSILSMPIAVIGAGSWGTALAILLARNGNVDVRIWSNETDQIELMQARCVNEKYLPGISFPDAVHPYSELQANLNGVRDILVAVPSHAFRYVLEEIKTLVSDDVRVVWGTKGLDPETRQLLHAVVAEIFHKETPVAVLAGPSFAKEVAEGKPTAVSLSGNQQIFMDDLVERLHGGRFRVYINPDMIGVQLCGAIKNVLAVAVGISDGLQLGANTRCALITRGLAEMSNLCVALGGKRETLLSLAGVGDLVLTCTGDQSRNRRFGLAIGRGISVEQATQEIGQAIEGLNNTRQVCALAKQYQVEVPIAEQVNNVLHHGHSPQDVLVELLERAPKWE